MTVSFRDPLAIDQVARLARPKRRGVDAADQARLVKSKRQANAAVKAESASRAAVGRRRDVQLRSDVVERMHRRGQLTDRQVSAAREIAELFEAFHISAYTKGIDYLRWAVNGGGRSGAREPSTGSVLLTLSVTHRQRWLPWADELGAVTVGDPERGITWLGLVISIVIDNRSSRSVEGEAGLRHGAASLYLKDGLTAYSVRRGA